MKVLEKLFMIVIVVGMLVVPMAAVSADPGQAILSAGQILAPAADGPSTGEVLSVFTQKVLEVVLPVVAAQIVSVLLALFLKFWAEWKQKQPDVVNQVEWLARTAVQAAEQANAAGLIQDKKDFAVDYIQRALSAKGLKLDVSLIMDAVEAAVWTEINSPITSGMPAAMTE